MSKRFLAIIAASVLVFIGLVAVNKKEDSTTSQSNTSSATDHTWGEGSSGVTVIEYGDFQCPACSSYYPVFTQLKTEFEDRVTFQFRHFPLVQIHQNAMAAHRAAEAAGLQNKFWEMHDLIYENQKTWENSNNAAQIFEDFATRLELDLVKYNTDVASSQVNASIQADLKAGQELGVTGTPTFVIDGKIIKTPDSIEGFRELINKALEGQQN